MQGQIAIKCAKIYNKSDQVRIVFPVRYRLELLTSWNLIKVHRERL